MATAYRIEEEDPPRCAYCDACEVANAGDYCSDECANLAAADEHADFLADLDAEATL